MVDEILFLCFVGGSSFRKEEGSYENSIRNFGNQPHDAAHAAPRRRRRVSSCLASC